jgi:hypothetical protein
MKFWFANYILSDKVFFHAAQIILRIWSSELISIYKNYESLNYWSHRNVRMVVHRLVAIVAGTVEPVKLVISSDNPFTYRMRIKRVNSFIHVAFWKSRQEELLFSYKCDKKALYVCVKLKFIFLRSLWNIVPWNIKCHLNFFRNDAERKDICW